MHSNVHRMQLTSVTANRLVFDGQITGRPISLLLSFDNGRDLRLAVAEDGTAMLVDDLPLDEPFDMGSDGSIVVEDVTDAISPKLRHAELTDVRALTLNARQVGVRLHLGGREEFNFWVEDDELFWGDGTALTTHPWLGGHAPALGEALNV